MLDIVPFSLFTKLIIPGVRFIIHTSSALCATYFCFIAPTHNPDTTDIMWEKAHENAIHGFACGSTTLLSLLPEKIPASNGAGIVLLLWSDNGMKYRRLGCRIQATAVIMGVTRCHRCGHGVNLTNNAWSYTSSPSRFLILCCLIKHRYKFTFTRSEYRCVGAARCHSKERA
jgi:hypothetical protein